jgi:hypothetical protein
MEYRLLTHHTLILYIYIFPDYLPHHTLILYIFPDYTPTIIQMGTVHSHPHNQLVRDGLGRLDAILCPSLFIAGSYVLNKFDMAKDIDLWIPYLGDDSDSQNNIVDTVVKTLLLCGYDYPRVAYSSKQTTCHVCDQYKRIHTMIRTMYKWTKRGKREVQLMVMNENGGRTATDIVKHFDLTMLLRYYHSGTIEHIHEDSVVRINLGSDIIKHQTFPEWCRTYERVLKYYIRGYSLSRSIIQHITEYVSKTLAEYTQWTRVVYKQRIAGKLNVVNYITMFNRVSLQLQEIYGEPCPYIMHTIMSTDGTCRSMSDIRIVVETETDYRLVSSFVNNCTPIWADYNDLSSDAKIQLEKNDRIPLGHVPPNQTYIMFSKKFTNIAVDSRMVTRPYIQQRQCTYDNNNTHSVFDMIDLEDYTIQEYLLQEDTIIIYLENKPYGIRTGYLELFTLRKV